MSNEAGDVAFMPWLTVASSIEVPGCRLLPYEREAEEEGSPVRRVLDCYRHGPNPIERAAVFEHDRSRTGKLSQQHVEAIFVIREALSFAAMRHRDFFGDAYCNHDTFTTIVQGFEGERGGALVGSRRRDGQVRHFYFEGVHEVRCPAHVDAHFTLQPDRDLVGALLRALGDQSDDISIAVRFYNLANTDAPNVPEAAEVILTFAALQATLGNSHESAEARIASAFEERMSTLVGAGADSKESSRSVGAKGNGRSLREAWIRDFYQTRGGLAHGNLSRMPSRAWTPREHLLLAGWLVPRLLERRLVDERHLTRIWADWTPLGELEDFDALLRLDDAFGAHERRGVPSFRWPGAIRGSQDERLRARVIDELGHLAASTDVGDEGKSA